MYLIMKIIDTNGMFVCFVCLSVCLYGWLKLFCMYEKLTNLRVSSPYGNVSFGGSSYKRYGQENMFLYTIKNIESMFENDHLRETVMLLMPTWLLHLWSWSSISTSHKCLRFRVIFVICEFPINKFPCFFHCLVIKSQ